MNQKLAFLVYISIALFLIALFAKEGTIALLSIPVLVYIFIGVLSSPTDIKISTERLLTKQEENKQGTFKQTIIFKNQGSKALALQINDAIFPGMSVENGSLSQSVLLSENEDFSLNYQFSMKRGCHTWKNIHIMVTDPLQVYQQHIILPAIANITVKPQGTKLQHLPLYPRRTLHLTGNIPARLAGSGTDLWGVRQYQHGDQLRHLNWKKIARNPRHLFTNEYEQEEITDIGLILDARSLGNHETQETEIVEQNIQAVASLAECFLREGNRVGLLILGSKLVHLFPGYGKNHLNKILFNIALVEQRSYISFAQLQYLPFRLFPARTQIIMVSAYNRNDFGGYKQLRAYGYPILLLSPDPFQKAPQMNHNTSDVLAYRTAKLDRLLQLQKLSKLGVTVINWSDDQPLNQVLQRELRQLKQNRRGPAI
jgi:uncharacterized protein (DUF58 family)